MTLTIAPLLENNREGAFMRTGFIWLVSIGISILAAIFIAALWMQAERMHPDHATIIESREDLNAFLQQKGAEGRNVEFKGQDVAQVPTGFFIQAMSFVTASTVNVNGYVWQKYPVGFPYEKGVNFPEEIASGDTVLDEKYRSTETIDGETVELIIWYFDVTLRQSFDYRHYPLDFLTVWLRVWPAELEADDLVLLTPDLDAYMRTDSARFGLDENIVSGEWSIDESFFSYVDVPYDTRFGFSTSGMTEPDVYSDFQFNLGVQRKFMNAFIVNLVPLFVVALLLFATLITITTDDKRSSRFGFSTSGILGTCSALFFVVMLAHIQVRSNFSGAGLVYIEYFYLVMYVMIMLVAVNAYLIALDALKNWRLLHWRDNLLPKVTYWPVLLWTLVVISSSELTH